MRLDMGSSWAGVAFLRTKKRQGVTCAVAALCSHNTYEILACPHSLKCVSAVQPFNQNNGLWVPSRWSKLQSVPVFWPFLYNFNFILGPGFIPNLSTKNMGRRWKPGWFGPRVWPPPSCYSAWLNKQQWTGRGRERGGEDWGGPLGGLVPSSPWQAGWPRRRRYRGRLFFCFVLFCAIRMGAAVVVWGPLYCETVQDPPISQLPSSPLHHSFTCSRPSISSARSAGEMQCYVDTQESEQTSSQRKRGLLLCQLPGKSAFYCH